MPVTIFKIPNPGDIYSKVNRNFLITGAALSVVKGAAFNAAIRPTETEESIGNSDLGTPVMDRLEFPEGNYIDLEGNEISFSGISIPTAILEVTLPKNIVKTPIQGRNGTVKEYVSDGDYQINGRGIISNTVNVIPLDDLRTFREIMQVPQQLEVVSQYLNEIFEINQIVIESFNMPQLEGIRNELPFSFSASSDVALDLEELE
jgi:hypothetical protein